MRRLPAARTILAGLAAALSVTSPVAATGTRVPGITASAVATTATPVVDATTTAALRASADRVRGAAHLEPLFSKPGYVTAANRIASALSQYAAVTLPSDQAPAAYLGGTTSDFGYAVEIEAAIAAVVADAHAVLAYPLHTDGGWSVVTRRLADGLIAYGVALVVGWPDPAVGAGTGCATSGYCWANRGLNPHLPWTRNAVTWYLSTSHLPSAGESLVRTAIANLNRVPGFGADLVYGGRTTDTAPTSAHRFLIVWGNACGTSSALACTTDSAQGTYRLVYQARTVVSSARYAADPDPTWWVGTLMHEIAHGVGLAHFDGTYLGHYQLMRWANGPDAIQAGDANGLRRIAPPGKVSSSLRAVRTSTGFALVVRTASTGLGGVRSVTSQCRDAAGVWRTVAVVRGAFDIRTRDVTAGTFRPPAGATRSCRAIVRSKAATVTTAWVSVSG